MASQSTTAGRRRLFALVALLPVWLALTALTSAPQSADASLVSALGHAHRPQDPSRKSLAWGPELKQVFASADPVADPPALGARGFSAHDAIKLAHTAAIHAVNAEPGAKDPHSVASRLARHLLGLAPGSRAKSDEAAAAGSVDFYVRPDSYTDPQSGISHYYVRQLVNGLEVADADLNVNVAPNGKILSFGSSLYTGKRVRSDDELDAHCDKLRAELGDLLFPGHADEGQQQQQQQQQEAEDAMLRGGAHQIVFDAMDRAPANLRAPMRARVDPARVLPMQEELHELCSVPSDDPLLQGADLGSRLSGSFAAASPSASSSSRSSSAGADAIVDPRLALVYFLQQATPDDALAAKLSNPDHAETEASQIFTTFEHKLQPHGGATASGMQPSHAQVEYLHNVPTATGPVSARLAYVRAESGELNLVWKFEVPLEDNAYETYVDATRPGSISTVVDWIHSMPRSRHVDGVDAIPELGRPDFGGYGGKGKSKKEQRTQTQGRVGNKAKATSKGWKWRIPGTGSKVASPPSPMSHDPLYKVFRWGLNDPTEGKRSYERGIRYGEASPSGWHTVPGSKSPFDSLEADDARTVAADGEQTVYRDTRGNNVFAQADLSGNGDWRTGNLHRPKGKSSEADGTDMLFDYPYPWRKAERNHTELSPERYAAAAVVQLFVTINEFHDMLYAYGFDEVSGNFQEHNFGRGGQDGDGVIAFAQDGAGTDNADFMTPPDGQRGRMRMYVWDQSTPYRDGDFEAGIVIHEYSHGLSTRLTGGPANSGCLGWGEAGGMGEGWGDVLASIIRRTGPKPHDWPMGSWASNRVKGIRNYPYSTNTTVNPETYAYLDRGGYWGVHAIGEVWATMLNEAEEALTAQHGFSRTLFPPATNATRDEHDAFFLSEAELAPRAHRRISQRRVPRHGNTLLVQLILDGMKLQPCRPSFFDARDAIIQADKHLTGGQNKCLLWKAFAKRGLGTDARVIGRTPWGGGKRTDGHAVPKECGGKQ
ncbi:uncharacterized protein PFL1_02115 [Pseudozyma flocculosa PF-1]|uniref:uncharacterized protein n=1 Tax=Pseudozyma flocculosa PF-1 TaxID=1277687 RepID=UPI000456000F|nr:uncharacterized protein PFL1_02115 [Pseudozyma flocculosa PF-1]EPQ30591.1 hypothetical protein PFL1_02115 [Pseudozyma flocculosa PF-1]